MLALCLMLSVTYYAQNYAGIIGWSLILISDLVVANLFMHSIEFPSMILLYLAVSFVNQRCFCMRYHHFCKVNNNSYKEQINASSWEHPRESTQHTAVELDTLYLLIIAPHQSKGLSKEIHH